MKIIILGGTKDSINIIKHLKKKYNTYILTTTTTEYGAKLAKEGGSDKTISKPLLKDEIIDIIKKEKFEMLIDATHPFAAHITQTSSEIADELKIPYIRFERPATNLKYIDTKNLIYVKSFKEAGKLIECKFNQGNILHFAGANTMEEILQYVNVERFYPRILKVENSLKKCEKLGIDKDHIIPMKGTSTIKENIELIEKYDAKVMITKESGEIGGVIEKIKAANEKNISIIMIQRPKIEKLKEKHIISDIEELDVKIEKFI